LGVIYVDTRGTANAFNDSDLEMLVALAAPAATAIKNAQYVKMVEQAYEDTLIALASAIELRDHYTVGHTWRVTNFAVEIARELGWDDKKLNEVQMGGVLHDVGKIAVDNAILGKPGNLTEEEFAQMKVHPGRGADLLRDIKFLHPLVPYCLCHHERWDGTGYPAGLKGEDIPIEGRVISVADAFDAMTSTRPYRKGMEPEIALERLREGKGKQFDPDLVDVLERCYEQGRIDRILQDYYKNEARSIACPFCSTFIRFDDTVADGSEIQCSVCRRDVRIVKKEETYFGVLAPKTEA
ncbi:MAG TPA: HD-GYP domain-containing protein, partial [Candidatus Hydrogenedentes bacterium]|nr:HD-GYP domain-containing protein [Candidatus Hydrogenedentota bacterium]